MLLLVTVMFACGPKELSRPDFPANVLSEQQFTELLTSFALAESAANMNVLTVPGHKVDSAYAFRPLEEHKVRPSQYDSTLAFYIAHPLLYKKVYENVLAALTEIQAQKKVSKESPDLK